MGGEAVKRGLGVTEPNLAHSHKHTPAFPVNQTDAPKPIKF